VDELLDLLSRADFDARACRALAEWAEDSSPPITAVKKIQFSSKDFEGFCDCFCDCLGKTAKAPQRKPLRGLHLQCARQDSNL
jgi:hypothetical protein